MEYTVMSVQMTVSKYRSEICDLCIVNKDMRNWEFFPIMITDSKGVMSFEVWDRDNNETYGEFGNLADAINTSMRLNTHGIGG